MGRVGRRGRRARAGYVVEGIDGLTLEAESDVGKDGSRDADVAWPRSSLITTRSTGQRPRLGRQRLRRTRVAPSPTRDERTLAG